MGAKELRIGNLIYIKQYNEFQTICEIKNNGQFSTNNYKHSYSSLDCASPIPLTEEWLVKLGFEKIKNLVGIFDKERLRIMYRGAGGIAYLKAEDDSGSHYIPNTINYVHQLMNLYFALTGEELTPNHITGE